MVEVAISDAGQRETKMLAAQAAVTPSLKASFRPRISPQERQNQLPFRKIAKRDCEKEFWPFLGPTIRATVLVGLTSVRMSCSRLMPAC